MDCVVNARGLPLNVIVLDQRILTSVAQRLNGVVLWKESEAKRVRLPSDERVGITTLLAILALHGEFLWVERWRNGLGINITRVGNNLARSEINVLVLVRPSPPANPLTQLASWHLVLIAATLAVPALWIAIIRTR